MTPVQASSDLSRAPDTQAMEQGHLWSADILSHGPLTCGQQIVMAGCCFVAGYYTVLTWPWLLGWYAPSEHLVPRISVFLGQSAACIVSSCSSSTAGTPTLLGFSGMVASPGGTAPAPDLPLQGDSGHTLNFVRGVNHSFGGM